MKTSAANAKPFYDISEYCAKVSEVLSRIPSPDIELVIQALIETHEAGGTVFLFGNGGSAALASHMACDLGKGMADVTPRRSRVLSLTDNVALITAWANDIGYEAVFSEQLNNYLRPGDVAFAISGSGNSPNVLRALSVARSLGATTVGLTGFEGGKAKELCDLSIVVPSDNMQIIEDVHTILAHGMFSVLRTRMRLSPPMGAHLGTLRSTTASAD